MSDRTRKEILTEFFQEVWNKGNLESMERFLAPKYKIHHDPGDPWSGKELDLEGFRERVRLSRAPFPDQQFAIQELFEDGDAVVASWSWTGTHKGDLPGFPASGKTIRMSGITVYYFVGDRIAGHWQVADRLSIFQQLQSDSKSR